MAINVQVKRLGRIKSKMRTDLWPPPPMLPEGFVRRFPELKTFNDDMKRWAERLRNMTEPDANDQVDPCS